MKVEEKEYCFVVHAEPREPDYDTTVHCVCLNEAMAKQVCEKMNAFDRFNNYEYYAETLHK